MQTAKQGYLRLGMEPVLDLPLDTADPMRFEPVDFGVTNPAIVFLDKSDPFLASANGNRRTTLSRILQNGHLGQLR